MAKRKTPEGSLGLTGLMLEYATGSPAAQAGRWPSYIIRGRRDMSENFTQGGKPQTRAEREQALRDKIQYLRAGLDSLIDNTITETDPDRKRFRMTMIRSQQVAIGKAETLLVMGDF